MVHREGSCITYNLYTDEDNNLNSIHAIMGTDEATGFLNHNTRPWQAQQ